MDPQANLREQIEISNAILKLSDRYPDGGAYSWIDQFTIAEHAQRLAELVLALDEWNKRK